MTAEMWSIIIADDSVDDRAEVRRMLLTGSVHRYQFIEVETGVAALAALSEGEGTLEAPRCLVLDFNLPDMNALECLAAMRGTDGEPRSPVVVITGDDTESNGRASLRAGAHGYVGKPWMTPQVLVRTIEVATEQWAMGRELRQQQRELQSISDHTPDLLTRYDRALRHVYVNTAAVTAMGMPQSELLGRTHRELGLDHLRWAPALREVFRTGARAPLEFSLARSPSARHYLATLVPEFDASGVVESVFCVAHDDTDRREIEEILRIENRRKTDFVATLAHELRNPLAPIRTGLEILAAAPAGSPASRQALDTMQRQLNHLVRLVDDLLEISRINSGKVELRRATVDVALVLEQAIAASRSLIDAAGHTLHVRIPAETILVNGDLVRLCQIVSNLLNNAAKYTPANGRIEIALTRTGDDAVIRVTDNGMGIARENFESIFGMYAQLPQRPDVIQGGLGVGLPLIRTLAALHGGSVTVESEGPGMGSTFTLRVPLSTLADQEADAALPPPVPFHRSASPREVPRRRVLVVDDNPDAALTLALSLDLSGHQTSVAHSGPAALEQLASFQPELAFVDIGMPGMSGYEVADIIRADPTLAGITLVALTGHGSPGDKARARAAGFHFHLTKPVEQRDVEKILAQGLGNFSDGPPVAS